MFDRNTKQKRLFTPGPLNTTSTVKESMLLDMGSRDERFVQLVAEIRDGILKVAGVSSADGYVAVPMQGSGTFGIEAVLSTVIGTDQRLLVLVNGAYGQRIANIADYHGIDYEVIECPGHEVHSLAAVEDKLQSTRFTHVAVVHCETTTGILNPIDEWGKLAKQHGCEFIVDAMSSLGGIPLDVGASRIDYLISSANKCLQGVPGFSFVVARRKALLDPRHQPKSLSLDLRDQLAGFEKDGQFRFTPPTHALLAFRQALAELEAEGGVQGRARRLAANHQALIDGMRRLGMTSLVPRKWQSHVITAFACPSSPDFEFADFYRRLAELGMLIYPGKLSEVDCFRIGNIGNLNARDVVELTASIERVLKDMGVPLEPTCDVANQE